MLSLHSVNQFYGERHVLWNVAAVLEVGGIQLGGPTGLIKNGKPWGTLDKSTGYYVVNWLGKRRHVHRLCYELAHGPIPVGKEVDHIDRDKTNNSPDNLRLASRGQNEQNKLPGANNNSIDFFLELFVANLNISQILKRNTL